MQQESFDTLKKAMSTSLVLKVVDPKKPFVLGIDAIGVAVGIVLNQDGRPVAFGSKKLLPSQHNCPIHESKKCM